MAFYYDSPAGLRQYPIAATLNYHKLSDSKHELLSTVMKARSPEWVGRVHYVFPASP